MELVLKGRVLQIGRTDQILKKTAITEHIALDSEDNWREKLKDLGLFDTIFFSPSLKPLSSAQSALQKASALLETIQKQFPSLSQIKYSDEDIDTFCAQCAPSEQIAPFLDGLKASRQITPQQHTRARQKHKVPNIEPPLDEGLLLLQTCVDQHLKPGGCMIWLASQSKFENPVFFENIITRSDLEYLETPHPHGVAIQIIKT